MVTLGGWLTQAQGIEFESYAAEIGLDLAALATILVVRELNHDRLAALIAQGHAHPPIKDRRVSARTRQAEIKLRFADHARKHRLSPDAAASAVFRAELNERWLGKCLGIFGNQVDSQA